MFSLFLWCLYVGKRKRGPFRTPCWGISFNVDGPPHPAWAVLVWGRGFDTSSERERNTYPFPLTKTILRLLFKQHHLTKQHRLKQKHSPRTILPIERRKARFQTWKRKMSHFYLNVGAVHLGTSFRKAWARFEGCFADLFIYSAV